MIDEIISLMKLSMKEDASDIHLTVNSPPILRINGKLKLIDFPPLSPEKIKVMIYDLLSDYQKEIFETERELDFSYSAEDLDRFRINIHYQKGNVEGAFRRIPKEIPKVSDLGIPLVALDLIRKPNGLILITGPTGVGKSTTLASLINVINQEREEIIISIEDPIEYVHSNNKSIIKQREVYSDTHSFPEALKRALRQDVDVIVVGEMRDLDTIRTTLTAAETGHLVLATLHTPDAPQTVQRIIDVFPPHQQNQVRAQLADTLQGIISQLLLPHLSGKGRVLATEVLIASTGVKNLIREGKIEQILSAMQMGAKEKMHTMDKCLKNLYLEDKLDKKVAESKIRAIFNFDEI